METKKLPLICRIIDNAYAYSHHYYRALCHKLLSRLLLSRAIKAWDNTPADQLHWRYRLILADYYGAEVIYGSCRHTTKPRA